MDSYFKLPLKCNCGKELTVFEISVSKDALRLDLICISCGSETMYVIRYERLIKTCIELEEMREGGNGHKTGSEKKEPFV